YFHNFFIKNADYLVDLSDGTHELLNSCRLVWRIGVVDTGVETMTGGRLLRLRKLLRNETFMVTYGDGVGRIDIASLTAFHQSHGRLATVTAVRPPSRFGSLVLDGNSVQEFSEKP